MLCLQCLDTVGWASGRASSCKKMSGEVLAWLSVWSVVQIICIWSSWCHCHPVISCFIKIQIGLAFLVPAYPGVVEKGLLNKCLDDNARVLCVVYRRRLCRCLSSLWALVVLILKVRYIWQYLCNLLPCCCVLTILLYAALLVIYFDTQVIYLLSLFRMIRHWETLSCMQKCVRFVKALRLA